MKSTTRAQLISILTFCTVLLLLSGCSKSNEADGFSAKSPEQAASALDQAFTAASAPVKQDVSAVSDALRKRDYEKAIVSLHAVQQAPGITLEQGMAIKSSSVLLERDLISAMERGDKNAEKAYQLLKRTRRN
jgi:uncharacterized lipoprotein YajG